MRWVESGYGGTGKKKKGDGKTPNQKKECNTKTFTH